MATRQGVCEVGLAKLLTCRFKQARGDVHQVQAATLPGKKLGVIATTYADLSYKISRLRHPPEPPLGDRHLHRTFLGQARKFVCEDALVVVPRNIRFFFTEFWHIREVPSQIASLPIPLDDEAIVPLVHGLVRFINSGNTCAARPLIKAYLPCGYWNGPFRLAEQTRSCRKTQTEITLRRFPIASKIAVEFKTQEEVLFTSWRCGL